MEFIILCLIATPMLLPLHTSQRKGVKINTINIMENLQYDIDTSFNNKFGSILNKYIPKIEEVKKLVKPKYEYEFQEVVNKFAPIYGKRMYTLPYQTWFTEYKCNLAHKECIKYNQVGNINYLIKVIRNMKI
jgi:hypothetical protein